MGRPSTWRLRTSPVAIPNGVALSLPHYGITSAARESRKASSGFCQGCLRYSKRGRSAHPFLHHKSDRRTKDSARCSAAKTSFKTITVKPHLTCGVLSSRILLQLSGLVCSPVATQRGSQVSAETHTIHSPYTQSVTAHHDRMRVVCSLLTPYSNIIG